MTVEEAMAIALDVYDILAEPWQKALREAVEAAGATKMQDPDFKAAVEGLLAWDGQVTPEQTATVMYKQWRLLAGKAVDVEPIREGKALDLPEQGVLLEKLDEVIRDMKMTYGTWEVAWGDVHKIGRGGHLFPVGGADFGGNSDAPNMTETLFDVRSKDDPDNPGQQIAYSGSYNIILMIMRPEGIESYSINQWGSSEDPNSPHYMDQGERLYSKRELKPTWWDKEELMEHVESTTVLLRE
jgi:acyl-homoserine lactone acylase PvdQ